MYILIVCFPQVCSASRKPVMFDFILPQGSQSIWLKPDPVMSSPPSFPKEEVLVAHPEMRLLHCMCKGWSKPEWFCKTHLLFVQPASQLKLSPDEFARLQLSMATS